MKWFIAYFIVLLVYAVFSYSLTAPNLIITSWPPYWQFQLWMWRTFFENHQLLTYTYIGLVAVLFGVYAGLVRWLSTSGFKLTLITYLLVLSPLLLAYNALSHDVFNYMFNAKMVRVYQADPHVKVALDFAHDDWLRFMHNTHTPAPYGYGWTGLSLLPSALGMEKFLPTWLAFRLFSVLSLVLLYGVYAWYRKQGGQLSSTVLALVLCNPLVIIEVIGNHHNDLWMMVPAVLSLLLISRPKLVARTVLLSAGLLIASATIKLATVLLIPLWLALVVIRWQPFATLKLLAGWRPLLLRFWPLAASLALFVPLLSLRSQQFHPWYLTWVLVWLPFFGQNQLPKGVFSGILAKIERVWLGAVLVLSISSLLRYTPWMVAGGFDGPVLLHQKLVTWIPFVLTVVGLGLFQVKKLPRG